MKTRYGCRKAKLQAALHAMNDAELENRCRSYAAILLPITKLGINMNRRRQPIEQESGGQALLVVGLHSSGKTTLSQAIASLGGFVIIELGDGVREEARRRAETNLVRVASGILASDDPAKLAKLASKRARANQARIPIFVGARTTLERDFLLSLFPQLLVVGLNTPDLVRRERWKHRQIMATDRWSERERWENRWQTRILVNQSDLRLAGTDSIPSMCKSVEEIICKNWKVNHVK